MELDGKLKGKLINFEPRMFTTINDIDGRLEQLLKEKRFSLTNKAQRKHLAGWILAYMEEELTCVCYQLLHGEEAQDKGATPEGLTPAQLTRRNAGFVAQMVPGMVAVEDPKDKSKNRYYDAKNSRQ